MKITHVYRDEHALLAAIRAACTDCRRWDPERRRWGAWGATCAADAWATFDAPRYHPKPLYEYDNGERYEIAAPKAHGEVSFQFRPAVTVLTLSARIAEDGTVTELDETVRPVSWVMAFEGDWRRHADRAAHWAAVVPDPYDPFDYTRSLRFDRAYDRAVTRLKTWSFHRLATVGITPHWDRSTTPLIHTGRYCTRVDLSGTDHEEVREEWIGGLPRQRRHLLATDAFPRLPRARDLTALTAGPGVVEQMRADVSAAAKAPKPPRAPFCVSSWVSWTCPSSGVVRRGVVVDVTEKTIRGTKAKIACTVLPDDGGKQVRAVLRGSVWRLKSAPEGPTGIVTSTRF